MLKNFCFISAAKGFCIIYLFLFCLSSPLSYGQNPPKQNASEIVKLETGKPIERGFSDGTEKQIYQINLTANQFADVTIEQHGVDVTARVFAANGDLLADVNSETTNQGTEKVELVAETSGNYQLEILPVAPKTFAGKYIIRLSEVHAATADEKLLDEARRKYYEALQLFDKGKFDLSLEAANQSLGIREKITGSSRADVAASLLLLGRINTSKNNLAEAEKFFQRAQDAAGNAFGKDSLNYAEVLHFFARLRFFQGKYDDMRQLTEQSLAIREKIMGAESLAAAASLHNLAMLYRATNNYPEAEKNFLKVLSIREKFLGENAFDTALVLNDFGLFYYGKGDFADASALLQRSLAVKEKIFPPNHWQIGIALNNLGLVAWKKQDYDQAKAYYSRALSIFEIANGPESDGVASISHNLGIIYKESDENYAKAEEYYLRALKIWEKLFGENHQATATAVTSLAILYRSMGDYDRAEKFELRAESINEKVRGIYNQYTLLSLKGLVQISVLKGNVDRAVAYQKKLSAIEEEVVPLNLAIGSERQKIAYYGQINRLDNIITLQAEVARDDESMRDLAVSSVLQYKGRILDALSENNDALRRRFNAEDQKLLDNLSDVNSRLAKLTLSGRQKASIEEQQNQIKLLTDERDKVESEISRQSLGFYQGSKTVTLAAVQSAVPKNAALIEFAVYRPNNWKARDGDKYYGEPRYIAYVIRPQEKVRWIELGKTAEIDAALDAYRKTLRDPKSQDVQKFARAADEKIMQPIRSLLGDAKQLLISPDGELNLIPFEALVDENNHYLVENFSFTYLTSGRDLLRMQKTRASQNKSLIIANPSFGELAEQSVAVNKTIKTKSRNNRQTINATRNMSDTYFAPLGGTLSEARSIQLLFPDATFLSGTQATESALKQTAAPRILHIATHGFFLQDTGNPDDASTSATRANTNNTENKIENPLLRSGLALAGANKHPTGDDDGVLTALEASGLNLWGTKLVVLSACDTGIGEVKNGEGVYGLRRAFTLAGAESLVMSLWSVSDYLTRELMTDYYKNLKQGMGRGAALRETQLEMMKRKGREHPFYWAAFIESGEWANLDGKR